MVEGNRMDSFKFGKDLVEEKDDGIMELYVDDLV
jgi:hypothetical protein